MVDRGRHRLGLRRDSSRSARCCSRARPVRLAGQDSPPRHLRASGTRSSSTARPARTTCRWRTCPTDQAPVLRLRLAAVASSRRWASSTATRWRAPTRWCCGRRSSATSSTARSRSSTSSSPPARRSGASAPSVVLLLPHGYEGQGPDHSSGRLERFLQLCAEDNMTVAIPSTPAQLLPPAAPAGATTAAQAAGRLHPEVAAAPARPRCRRSRTSPPARSSRSSARPERLDPARRRAGAALLRQGLLRPARRRAPSAAITDTAIVRLEQLYPLPVEELKAELAPYPDAEDCGWVQEEPANQGAWPFIALNLLEHLGGRALRAVSRPASAVARRSARPRCTTPSSARWSSRRFAR